MRGLFVGGLGQPWQRGRLRRPLFLLIGGNNPGDGRKGLIRLDGGLGLRLGFFINPEQAAVAVAAVAAVQRPVEHLALGRRRQLGQFYPAPGPFPGVGHLVGGHKTGQLIEPLLDLARQRRFFGEVELLVVLLHQGCDGVVIDVHDVVGLRLVGVDLVEELPIGGITAA